MHSPILFLYAYECKPAIIKFTTIKLNIMIAKPITASQADFSPCHPLDNRKCSTAKIKEPRYKCPNLFRIPAPKARPRYLSPNHRKINAPNVKTGNPIAIDRYPISSSKSLFVFFTNG